MSTLTDILQSLGTADRLYGAYQAGGLQVQVKTNYGPPVTVYNGTAAAAPPNLIERALGLQWGVRVYDAGGNLIAEYGTWPPTDPVRVAVGLGVLAAAGFGLLQLARWHR